MSYNQNIYKCVMSNSYAEVNQLITVLPNDTTVKSLGCPLHFNSNITTFFNLNTPQTYLKSPTTCPLFLLTQHHPTANESHTLRCESSSVLKPTNACHTETSSPLPSPSKAF